MNIQKFCCPFCKNEFFNLPTRCYVCNKELPQELVGKMAFVVALQEGLKKIKEDGFVDEDLFANIMKLCSERESFLQEKLSLYPDGIKESPNIIEETDSPKQENLSDIDVNLPEQEKTPGAEPELATLFTEKPSLTINDQVSEAKKDIFTVESNLLQKDVDVAKDIEDEVDSIEQKNISITEQPSTKSTKPLETEKTKNNPEVRKEDSGRMARLVSNILTSEVTEAPIEFTPSTTTKNESDPQTSQVTEAPVEFTPSTTTKNESDPQTSQVTEAPIEFTPSTTTKNEPDPQTSQVAEAPIEFIPSTIKNKSDTQQQIQPEKDTVEFTPQSESVAKKEIAAVFPVKETLNKNIQKTNTATKQAAVLNKIAAISESEKKPLISYLGHPAIKENILLFIGIFLIMVGEVFVVSNSWSGFSTTMQTISIYGLVLSSSLLFSFIGYFIAKRMEIKVGGSILFFIAIALMPLTFIPIGNLYPFLKIITTAITLAIYTFIALKIARFFHAELANLVLFFFIPLCAAHIIIASIPINFFWWVLCCYGTAFFTISALNKLIKIKARSSDLGMATTFLWACLFAIAWGEFALHLHYTFSTYNYSFTVAQYAPIMAILAIILGKIDYSTEKDTPLSILTIFGICAIALGITMSIGNEYMILVTCAIGVLFFASYTKRFRRYYFLQATLLLSVVSYFFLPLLLGKYALTLRNYIINIMGYNLSEIPYALYGVAFLPYIAFLCILGRYIHKWEPPLLKHLQMWFATLAFGISALVQFGSPNLYTPLIVFPICAMCYLSVVSILRMPSLYYLTSLSLSIWVFDIAQFMGIPLEKSIFSLLALAIFWYLGATLKFVKDEIRKPLLDTSFICAFAIPIIGIVSFTFPPTIIYSVATLLASLWLLLSIFVYQSKWLWTPCFSLAWFSVFLLFHHYIPQNYQDALLLSASVWGYGAVLIAAGCTYLQQKITRSIVIYPGRKEQGHLLHQPLSFLLPLPIFVVILLAIMMWNNLGENAIYALWAVSLIPFIMQKVTKVNHNYAHVSLFPFSIAIIYALTHITTNNLLTALSGSVIFSILALLLRQSFSSIVGTLVSGVVLHFITEQYQMPVSEIATWFCYAGILLFFISKILPQKTYKQSKNIISITNVVYAAYAIVRSTIEISQNPALHSDYIWTFVLAGMLIFLVFTQYLSFFLLTISFICWSTAIVFATNTYFENSYPAISFVLTMWGCLWWILNSIIEKYWYKKEIVSLIPIYPILNLVGAYAIATYFMVMEPRWMFIPTLLVCATYSSFLCIRSTNTSIAYCTLALLNQIFLSIYHLIFSLSPGNIVLAQTIVSTIFFVLSWLEYNYNNLDIAEPIRYFSLLTILATVIYAVGWRVSYIIEPSMFTSPPVNLFCGVCLIATIMLLGLCYKIKNSNILHFSLATLWFTILFAIDIFETSFGYYVFSTVALSFLYAVLPIIVPFLRSDSRYADISSILSSWGTLLGVAALMGSVYRYEQFSSICVVLLVAFNLLVIQYLRPKKENIQAYYGVFGLGLLMLGVYLAELDKVNSYIESLPVCGSLLSVLFCFISWKTQSWRVVFYRELARYVSYIALIVAVALGYLTSSPAPSVHILILLFCSFFQIIALLYIGWEEKLRVSHYLMLSIFVGMYALLRSRTHLLNVFSGYDEVAIILLFIIVPSIIACFIKTQKSQLIISNFSLLCLVGLFLKTLDEKVVLHYIPTYLILLASIVIIRQSYTKTQIAENKNQEPSTGLLVPFLTINSVLASLHSFFIDGTMSQHLFASNSALVALCCFMCFIFYRLSGALWLGLVFTSIAGYTLFVYQKFSTSWHPMYFVIFSNIVLLLLLFKTVFKERLDLYKEKIESGITLFVTSILYAIILVGATWYVKLVFNMDLEYLQSLIGKNFVPILVTGLATIVTALHLMIYNKKIAHIPLLAAFVILGLTAPISHIINNIDWSTYSLPVMENALLAIAFCFFGHRYQSKSCNIFSIACLCLVILFNNYDIHEAATFITLFITSFHLLYYHMVLKNPLHKQAVYHAYTLNLLLAIYFTCFYLLPKTGKPVPLVFPLLALIASSLALLFMWLGTVIEKIFSNATQKITMLKKNILHTNIFFSIISLVFVLGAVTLIAENTPKVTAHVYQTHVILCLASLSLLIVQSLILAHKTQNIVFYYEFQVLVIGTFLLLRYRVSWFSFLEGYEPHALIVFAITFFQIGNFLINGNNKKNVAHSFLYSSYMLPLIALFYYPTEFKLMSSSLLFMNAVHFCLIYIMRQSRLALYAMLAFLDLGLYQFWQRMEIVDPQFYGIPLGLTVIIFAELNRKEMKENKISNLHKSGLFLIYGSSAVQLFLQFNNPTYAIILGAICFVGIIVGFFLKNNLYIFTAAVFLVMDILAYVIKFGMEKGILPGMLLVLAGTVVIGGYIYSNRNKK